jgi:peptide-methionine (S)-S-oxide reductase
VVDVAVGYAGGHTIDPTYRQVCGKDTGHAEVFLVEFDPSRICYAQVLEAFFEMHAPSNWSPGGQYRSAIFTYGDEQRAIAEQVRDGLRAEGRRVLTEITPAPTFWRAEEYHQRYLEKRGLGASCRF